MAVRLMASSVRTGHLSVRASARRGVWVTGARVQTKTRAPKDATKEFPVRAVSLERVGLAMRRSG